MSNEQETAICSQRNKQTKVPSKNTLFNSSAELTIRVPMGPPVVASAAAPTMDPPTPSPIPKTTAHPGSPSPPTTTRSVLPSDSTATTPVVPLLDPVPPTASDQHLPHAVASKGQPRCQLHSHRHHHPVSTPTDRPSWSQTHQTASYPSRGLVDAPFHALLAQPEND